ncbi:MAG: BrnA antitoxin family protein [Candidatus Edwardsbacteria bacterium]|nr:BrnA antitoxin family protein [Candidatus Edwardsbacteria bacterium]
MTDKMIDTSDIPPLTEEFFAAAKWRMPKPKVKVTVEIEPEVAVWFKAQGENYQRYLAAALRIYAQAHQAFKK